MRGEILTGQELGKAKGQADEAGPYGRSGGKDDYEL